MMMQSQSSNDNNLRSRSSAKSLASKNGSSPKYASTSSASDQDARLRKSKNCSSLSLKSLSSIISSATSPTIDDRNSRWWACLAMITIAAFATRLYKIEQPNHVCWDETHFGKMGSWYINHTFFFDVHPPLGKMLIGLSGYLTGYNGTFPFNKPGDNYHDYPILGMRLFCVILGTLIVPFSFVIVWNFSQSFTSSILASAMLLFDVGMITLSQYILLDPILLFFIVSSTLGMAVFKSQSKKPFQIAWWFWLTWTGFFLACSISVKFVGLFVVLLVGVFTIYDLWQLFGDLSNSMPTIGKHFAARAFCLIILPILLYMFFFWIHFAALYKSGNGDGFYSSAFQSTLEGNSLHNASMPRHVAYGATITVKNHRTGGAYLHSHWHLYPEGVGARQQQVTTYSHKDDNNKWRIKKYSEESEQTDAETIELVKNGDLIRLEHVVTERNLHSHQEIAPVTKKHFQVTCYGEKGVGDANDVFRVEFETGKIGDELEAVKTRFKLVHYLMNCALYSHNKQLPKWGFEQLEVTCTPNVYETKNTLWNVEDNLFPRLPNVSVDVYAPSFFEKFIESHAVMFQGNAGLKPKEGEVTSRPWQWPINYRGQFFSGNDFKIYLLGNPIIWWLNLSLLLLYVFICLTIIVRQRRGCAETAFVTAENDRFLSASVWLFFGWALHYFPFFGMGRILYFHHYFPAAIFSSMLSAVIIDYLLSVVPVLLIHITIYVRRGDATTAEQAAQSRYQFAKSIFHLAYGTLLAALAYSFYLFSPLAYGIVRLPPTSIAGGNASSAVPSSIAERMSTDAVRSAETSEFVDYSSERSMQSLRWMESWEF